jgi:hypothetical protein
MDRRVLNLIKRCGGQWLGYMAKFGWSEDGQNQMIRGLRRIGWDWLWCSHGFGKAGGWIGITPVAPVQVEE